MLEPGFDREGRERFEVGRGDEDGESIAMDEILVVVEGLAGTDSASGAAVCGAPTQHQEMIHNETRT